MNSRLGDHAFLAAVCTVLFLLLPGCGGSDSGGTMAPPLETPTLSYDDIVGDWSGELTTGGEGTFWDELSIDRRSAEVGEVVGTESEYTSEGGDLYCGGELLASENQPPSYYFQGRLTEEGVGDCSEQVWFRLDYDADAGTLTMAAGESRTSLTEYEGTLTREGG